MNDMHAKGGKSSALEAQHSQLAIEAQNGLQHLTSFEVRNEVPTIFTSDPSVQCRPTDGRTLPLLIACIRVFPPCISEDSAQPNEANISPRHHITNHTWQVEQDVVLCKIVALE